MFRLLVFKASRRSLFQRGNDTLEPRFCSLRDPPGQKNTEQRSEEGRLGLPKTAAQRFLFAPLTLVSLKVGKGELLLTCCHQGRQWGLWLPLNGSVQEVGHCLVQLTSSGCEYHRSNNGAGPRHF